MTSELKSSQLLQSLGGATLQRCGHLFCLASGFSRWGAFKDLRTDQGIFFLTKITSGAEAPIFKVHLIAAPKALRHPKAKSLILIQSLRFFCFQPLSYA